MDKTQAAQDVKVIREIMETSARYTSFSGISGIVAGTLALLACVITGCIAINAERYASATNAPYPHEALYYGLTWAVVLVAALCQDVLLAQRKARKRGETIWTPATIQVIKATLPGVFLAFVLSLRALTLGEVDAIPAIWSLGYGVALCAAGRFSVREVRIFGTVQLLSGAVVLFLFSWPPASLYALAVTFGLYHILYGLWLVRRYGW
jgi:hypothetical protein